MCRNVNLRSCTSYLCTTVLIYKIESIVSWFGRYPFKNKGVQLHRCLIESSDVLSWFEAVILNSLFDMIHSIRSKTLYDGGVLTLQKLTDGFIENF